VSIFSSHRPTTYDGANRDGLSLTGRPTRFRATALAARTPPPPPPTVSAPAQDWRAAQAAIACASRQGLVEGLCRPVNALAASAPRLFDFDLEPLYETARLLYEGPWVAERYLVAAIWLGVRRRIATIPSRANHGRRRIKRLPQRILSRRCTGCIPLSPHRRAPFAISTALVLPTAPTAYSTAQGWPIRFELQQPSRHLHQFVNLLDLWRSCAAGYDPHDAIPFGNQLLRQRTRRALASLGRVFHAKHWPWGILTFRCRRSPPLPQ